MRTGDTMGAKENKKTYDIQYYHKFITRKLIPVNRNVPEDVEMLEFFDTLPSFTQYVKGLIREDMKRRSAQDSGQCDQQ